ncbi:hypothetical protein EON62_06305, partial [archaeon]
QNFIGELLAACVSSGVDTQAADVALPLLDEAAAALVPVTQPVDTLSEDEETRSDAFREGVVADLNTALQQGVRPVYMHKTALPSASEQDASLLRPATFMPHLQLARALCSNDTIVAALITSPLWLPVSGAEGGSAEGGDAPPVAITGQRMQTASFLGRVLCLGPTRTDVGRLPADMDDSSAGGARDALDLLASLPHAEAEAEVDVSSVGVVGVPKLLPLPLTADQVRDARRTTQEVLARATKEVQAGFADYMSEVRALVETIMRRKGRDAVFSWVGTLLDTNTLRTSTAYSSLQRTPQLMQLSSPALMGNVTRLFVALCMPFADPCDPKATKLDLRFFTASAAIANGNGGGR